MSHWRLQTKWWLILSVVVCVWFLFHHSSRSPHAKATITRQETKANTRTKEQIPDEFWKSARVPETPHFREPVIIDPATLGVTSRTISDHPRRIEGLEGQGDVAGLNEAVAEWFDVDPIHAREWIATKGSLSSLQPALQQISTHIAEQGECELALEWARLLESPAAHEQALVAIYATGMRQGKFTKEAIEQAPLPDTERARILGGSAGD